MFRWRGLSLALREGWCHGREQGELEWVMMVVGGDCDY